MLNNNVTSTHAIVDAIYSCLLSTHMETDRYIHQLEQVHANKCFPKLYRQTVIKTIYVLSIRSLCSWSNELICFLQTMFYAIKYITWCNNLKYNKLNCNVGLTKLKKIEPPWTIERLQKLCTIYARNCLWCISQKILLSNQ